MKEIKIALVGQSGSGKDTVANYLTEKYWCTHVSSGDLLRAYVAEHTLGEPTKPVLNALGITLRNKFGADFLVRMALEKHLPRLVLSGLRAVPEVEAFKKAGGVVIGITAPLRVRYERAKARGNIDSNRSFEEFEKFEALEEKSRDPNAQNLSAVLQMADVVIENEGTREELFGNVDEILKKQV